MLREFANFMDFYPAYDVDKILGMYALTFFSLLNEGYRMKNRHYEMLSFISDLPHSAKDVREKFYNSIEWATKDPSDILNLSGQGSSEAEIKKALGG